MTPSNPATPGNNDATGGLASGRHQSLHHPADDDRVEAALDNIGLDDRGELMEDHLRDRRSKGVRGGYDDSINHHAAGQPDPDQQDADLKSTTQSHPLRPADRKA
jgi:hypothetical protein